ncbi:MAG: S-adenosylmethionine synthetase, partial [Deltaproteobacteria bacterium]|nr:S-adenosylmethionine synthetase [Deltaproteobacteria bacterium]
ERFLNSKGFKERFPETGEDVKVMGFRKGTRLDITFAMPLLAKLVSVGSDPNRSLDPGSILPECFEIYVAGPS